jgi:hypothetical protein
MLQGPLGLLPVLLFLGALVWLDSYKLDRLRAVLAVIAAIPTAWARCTQRLADRRIGHGAENLLRYALRGGGSSQVARHRLPVHSNRIGFLVDAAIMGFAVGAGFALVENFYYLQHQGAANLGVWVVRGFGTAIMHGGVAAMFAIMSQTLTERQMKIKPLYYLPGLAVAAFLHSVFNHFLVAPVLQAVGTLLVLPPLLQLMFHRSARRLHQWMEVDFDQDALLIEMITSGAFSESKIGRFLDDLRTKFEGPVVVDMLCYLRIHTELAIRAKAVLMARENGLELPMDDRTREKFEELHYLEQSIGKTGCLAMKPFLMMERKTSGSCRCSSAIST